MQSPPSIGRHQNYRHQNYWLFNWCSYAVSLLVVAAMSSPVAAQSARLPSATDTTSGRIQKERSVESFLSSDFRPSGLIQEREGIRLVAPRHHEATAHSVLQIVGETRKEYELLFGSLNEVTTTILLMDAEEFYLATGTPEWTNAIFFRKKIVIPLDKGKIPDQENLLRSIRHEYLHAVTYDLSAGKLPGWLDEGIAQWIEGKENPALGPALKRWLVAHQPLPLSLLKGGFTKLDTAMVPAAYGQSLFAARHFIEEKGFRTIKMLLSYLKEGQTFSKAFENSTGTPLHIYEKQLAVSLSSWAHGSSPHALVEEHDEDVS